MRKSKPLHRVSRTQLQRRLIARAWEDDNFKKELLKDPMKAVERELAILSGKPVRLGRHIQIHIHEEKPGELHFVLPPARDVFASDDKDLVIFWESVLQA